VVFFLKIIPKSLDRQAETVLNYNQSLTRVRYSKLTGTIQLPKGILCRKDAKMAKKKSKTKSTKKGRKGLWTTADVNQLKKLFPETPTAQIAKKLGRKLDTVKKKASRMGLKKSKRYLRKLGRGK